MPNAEGRMEEAQLADMIGRLTRSVQSGRSVLFSVGRYEMEQLLAALAARTREVEALTLLAETRRNEFEAACAIGNALQADKDALITALAARTREVEAMRAENGRMRAALTHYANAVNWMSHTDADAMLRVWIGSGDGPDYARRALAAQEGTR